MTNHYPNNVKTKIMNQSIARRILPQTDIGGTKFYVNSITGMFHQVSDPNNEFSIFDLVILDDHLEVLFDKSTCRPYDGNWGEAPDTENLVYLWLRPVSQLDPEGMNIMLKGGLIRWEEYYAEELPTVKIHDTLFFIDPERKGFREVENRWNIISFKDVVSQGRHGLYYDPVARNSAFMINPYDPPKMLPAGVVFAKLPPLEEFQLTCSKIKTKTDIILEEKSRVQNKLKQNRKKGRRV